MDVHTCPDVTSTSAFYHEPRCGAGALLPVAATRRFFALRLNVLVKGHSGIYRDTLNQMVDAFNAGCMSAVPERGTVGASGDLAPRHDGKTSRLDGKTSS